MRNKLATFLCLCLISGCGAYSESSVPVAPTSLTESASDPEKPTECQKCPTPKKPREDEGSPEPGNLAPSPGPRAPASSSESATAPGDTASHHGEVPATGGTEIPDPESVDTESGNAEAS